MLYFFLFFFNFPFQVYFLSFNFLKPFLFFHKNLWFFAKRKGLVFHTIFSNLFLENVFFHFFFKTTLFCCSCQFYFFYFNQRNRLSIFLILLTVFSLKRGGSFSSLTNFLITSVQIFFPLKSNIDIYHMISRAIFSVGKTSVCHFIPKYKNQLD